MASLIPGKNGTWQIQFKDKSGYRQTIRLPKLQKRDAQQFKFHSERLNYAAISNGTPDDATGAWLTDLSDVLYRKLVKAGLATPKGTAAAMSLKALCEKYLGERTDLKTPTREHLGRTRKQLYELFGEDKPISDLNAADAKRFQRWLGTDKGQSLNTVRRNCARAKQFLNYAVEARHIPANPFRVLKGLTVKGNRAKHAYVTREQFAAVVAHCPDDTWKAIVTLARIGGLRIPHELTPLTWGDVLWDQGKLRVRSSKTEHTGHGERFVPLWPELREALARLFEEPGKPAKLSHETIFRFLQGNRTNLRTTFGKILARAGITPWPKPFINCRSSRATELAQQHPSYLCCAWLGHTEAVADEHYRQIRDEDYLLASGLQPPPESALQKARHSLSEMGGNSSTQAVTTFQKTPLFPRETTSYDTCTNVQTTRQGFEP